jgi:DNA invertase Pin-like site-specific DNA recombinase
VIKDSRERVSKGPALNELHKDCRRGSVDVVVDWKFDRFARSLNALISDSSCAGRWALILSP